MKRIFLGLVLIGTASAVSARPLCSKITDDFCERLWKKNNGNMQVFDGRILAGTTNRSEMSAIQRAYYEAWIRSEKRLPADFRARVAPAIRDLKKALSRERDDKEWYTELSLPSYRLDLAIDETVQARVEKRWPKLKKVRVRNRTFNQERRYWQENTHLRDQIVIALFKHHPNWKRVEKNFQLARQDILDEVEQLKISPELKEWMIRQVSSVRLVLPLLNPQDALISDSCQRTEVNSYYLPATHTFTVCAGMFNGFQTDAAIYLSIAHEIGHSIDPLRMATDQLIRTSEMYKGLQKLKGAQTRAFNCDEWDQFRNKYLKPHAQITEPPAPEMGSLYNCLVPDLKPKSFDTEAIRHASAEESLTSIDGLVNPNQFTKMAQPTFEKEGKIQPNEFFMNPTLMRAFYNRGFDVLNKDPFVWLLDVFTQVYSCERIKVGGAELDYTTDDIDAKKAMFEHAIRETEAISQVLFEEWFSVCGRNCPELSRYGLAKDKSENFADWIGFHAFAHYLGREPDLEHRREITAIGSSILCEPPSPMTSAPYLTAIEKTFSLEVHPNPRVRRISVYNEKVAASADCEIDNDIRAEFGMCQQ